MIAEDAKHLAAQLDTVFEDVQMMWFDGAREPVVVPIAHPPPAAGKSPIGGLVYISPRLARAGRGADRAGSSSCATNVRFWG